MTETVPCNTGCVERSGHLDGDATSAKPGGPAIDGHIPFDTPLRDQVRETICGRCWRAWLEVQIKVINEFALNLGDARSHAIIEAHARDFLGLSDGSETGMDFARLGEKPPEAPPAH